MRINVWIGRVIVENGVVRIGSVIALNKSSIASIIGIHIVVIIIYLGTSCTEYADEC